MNLIKSLPGPFLVFLGAVSLSFGGLIVKSFEGSTLWQILFWRSVFFILVVSIFLFITYKKKVFNALYKSGLPGFIGGIILWIWMMLPSKGSEDIANIKNQREGHSSLGKSSFVFGSIGLTMFLLINILLLFKFPLESLSSLLIVLFLSNIVAFLTGIPALFQRRSELAMPFSAVICSVFTTLISLIFI